MNDNDLPIQYNDNLSKTRKSKFNSDEERLESIRLSNLKF
jgi:hypothetical protein